MKKIFIILSVAILSLTFSSCEKCLKCSYTYTDNGQEITSEVGEQCGAEEDLTQLEIQCEDAAQTVGGTCACTGR